ncbi:hypothetical protein R7M47_10750 [Bacillus inaquosorum]|uniref:hypothetical protein n=1 Tax=Bacillus inaquosorum TaxID=483913 RepID=UPI003899B95E
MNKKSKITIFGLLLIPCLILTSNFEANAAKAKHTGKMDYKSPTGSTLYERAIGETTWKGKYHYTRAQEVGFWGRVDTDSGRKWGKDHTKATSPWATADGHTGKTYYGS